jgi:UDP-2,3-diacylglucosamine hydrolase
MKAIFISDAHLRKSEDERYKKLMIFLNAVKEGNVLSCSDPENHASPKAFIDDLYIAGDLFDFWFCTKDKINPEFTPAIQKLVELQKSGIRIHLCEGNHDFFMGEYFRDIPGMNVFEETADANLDALKVLVAHGDTADRANTRYLLFRKFLRSRFFYNLQRFIPASVLWALAGLSSTASKEMTSENGDVLVKKMTPFALKKFQEGYDAVVLGHSHFPGINYYTISGRQKIFITLGDWMSHYSFLYYEDNHFFLRHYRS